MFDVGKITANVPPALRSWGFLFPNHSVKTEAKYTKRPFHLALKPQFLKAAVRRRTYSFNDVIAFSMEIKNPC